MLQGPFPRDTVCGHHDNHNTRDNLTMYTPADDTKHIDLRAYDTPLSKVNKLNKVDKLNIILHTLFGFVKEYDE